MKTILLLMLFQMILGFWVIFSPFAVGFYQETAVALSDIVFGSVLVVMGLAIFLHETSPSCRQEICT